MTDVSEPEPLPTFADLEEALANLPAAVRAAYNRQTTASLSLEESREVDVPPGIDSEEFLHRHRIYMERLRARIRDRALLEAAGTPLMLGAPLWQLLAEYAVGARRDDKLRQRVVRDRAATKAWEPVLIAEAAFRQVDADPATTPLQRAQSRLKVVEARAALGAAGGSPRDLREARQIVGDLGG